MSKKNESTNLPIAISLPRNLRITEAAEYLGCTAHWIRLQVKAKKLTPLVMGRRFVFPEEELLRYRSELAQESDCMAAVR